MWLEQYFDIISLLYILFTVSNQSDRLANCHGFAGVYFLCHYPDWDITLHRLGKHSTTVRYPTPKYLDF